MTNKVSIKGLVANYGLLFIFAMGVLYAFIRPEGLLLNGVFLLIVIGWVIFLIKYFCVQNYRT